ncbi:MFS transporter [Janthinobacterium lividum]|uniref:MFS transporter n=1 Tax=Janthinobacterium lividum TaxID=29581 RepID=UPI000874F883|nr:MFS transporter [Janthinobacterium lividum]MCC7713043.1 MFS transporter [Janthinobacterium lividum]WQE31477.1 MFS transporter [Janthinobacterium lividum]
MKTAPDSAIPAAPHKAAILAIILVSYVMIVLDTSIVLTGLPKIHQELGFTDTGLAWVQSAYTLTFGGLLLLAARAGDAYGRRRLLQLGLALFTLASLAIGLARSPAMMIAARAIQGVGAAILAPSTLALLQTTFAEGRERTRAIALYSAVAGIAASVGLVLGGVLAEWLSWRVGFFINLPIGAVMLVAARRFVAESARSGGQFDVAGAASSTFGLSALVYGLIRSAGAGWGDALTQGALAAGVLLLAAFIFIERRAAQPVLPLRLFADAQRNAAYGARVLFLGAMIGFFFFSTQFLQVVLGYPPSLTGLAFLPMTLVNFGVALCVPRLTRGLGNARLLAMGLGLTLLGMAWLSRVDTGTAYWLGVALPMLLIGAGQGMALSPLTAAGVAGVPAQDAGAASGIVNVAHQLGSSLGLATLVAVAGLGAGQLAGAPLLAHRVTVALGSASAMLALALLLILTCQARPPKLPPPSTAST